MFKKLDCQLQNGVNNCRKSCSKNCPVKYYATGSRPLLATLYIPIPHPTYSVCHSAEYRVPQKGFLGCVNSPLRQDARSRNLGKHLLWGPCRDDSIVAESVDDKLPAPSALPLCIKLSSATLRYLIRSPTHDLSHTAAMRVSYL